MFHPFEMCGTRALLRMHYVTVDYMKMKLRLLSAQSHDLHDSKQFCNSMFYIGKISAFNNVNGIMGVMGASNIAD